MNELHSFEESETSLKSGCVICKTILSSRQPLMVGLKWALLALLLSLPLLLIRQILYSLAPANFYQRDLIQEYLLSRALLVGEELYLPLSDLAAQFTPDLPVSVFSHPTPHPPPVALFFLPMALLTYEQFVVVWFVFEIICVFVVSYLLLGWWGKKRKWWQVIGLSILTLGWEPFVTDIAFGQISFVLCFFLILSWLALRENRDIPGGLLLGLVISLKLMALPIIVYLLIKRRWRAVIAAGTVVAASNLLMAFLMGVEDVIYYYRVVGPAVAALYADDVWNVSMWGLGWSVFNGTTFPNYALPPLINAPSLATYGSLTLSCLVVGIGEFFALRNKIFDVAFAILVCVSILVGPTAWSHYFTWLIVPIHVLACLLYRSNFPFRESLIALFTTSAVSYTWGFLSQDICQAFSNDMPPYFLRWIWLVMYVPTFAVLIMVLLLARCERGVVCQSTIDSRGMA